MLKKKQKRIAMIVVMVATLIFMPLAPSATVFADELQAESNDAELIASFDYEVVDDEIVSDGYIAPSRPLLKSNQTTNGGSTYTLQTRKVVNIKSYGTVHNAVLAAGLSYVFKGFTIASTLAAGIVGFAGSYKYMRQSIYSRKDKKWVYYKVINEFSNNTSNFKGAVTTNYYKVSR
ncbi:hypothetical protein [Listeria costaricensis]|uniref:hypothetical protein n=1 Tax=Listeria costaricensis TaxID=2026604 RepID=UPI000C081800|nr:hypothetical protein [Listeria costaricensis]